MLQTGSSRLRVLRLKKATSLDHSALNAGPNQIPGQKETAVHGSRAGRAFHLLYYHFLGLRIHTAV